VITEASDLRKKITTGVSSPDDARRTLAELRERHRKVATQVSPIKIAYDRALKIIEDPATKVAELMSRFGSLRQ
jgi:hypothetical protein